MARPRGHGDALSRRAISPDEFLKLVRYRPVRVGKELCDPVRFIPFRKAGAKTAHIEFGTTPGRQDFYFEVVDWAHYIEGEIIPVNSNRRSHVISEILTRENMASVAERVNGALRDMYSRKGAA